MSLRFYNTLSREVEEFIPRENGKVSMYVCGPTVYNRAHIGNFRTFLFTDLLHRYLRYRGYEVEFVMNVTDIDDKTIKGAIAEGITLNDFTSRYAKAFFDDCNQLGILPASRYPRATEHIPEMINIVETLIARGHAYQAKDSVYYKVDSCKNYGNLAHLNMSEMRVGERVASDEYEKDDVRDFALWKGYEPEDGNVFWETPFGKGRPGWHLECSAMSLKYLGENFDIHCGGVDLIFPHHQNEIAQTEGVTGKPVAKYWIHSEHLLVNGSKMSKSANNFYTLSDLMGMGWKPEEIRFALMAAHYRQQLNFTFEGLSTARAAMERFSSFIRNLRFVSGKGRADDILDIVKKNEAAFQAAMDDDLNYPEAIASVFNLVRDVNAQCAAGRVGEYEASQVFSAIERINSVLGFMTLDQCDEADAEIDALVEARDEARRTKNWAEADRIRDKLASCNVILEDRSGKTSWRRK